MPSRPEFLDAVPDIVSLRQISIHMLQNASSSWLLLGLAQLSFKVELWAVLQKSIKTLIL
jgi:hypothetical protein